MHRCQLIVINLQHVEAQKAPHVKAKRIKMLKVADGEECPPQPTNYRITRSIITTPAGAVTQPQPQVHFDDYFCCKSAPVAENFTILVYKIIMN